MLGNAAVPLLPRGYVAHSIDQLLTRDKVEMIERRRRREMRVKRGTGGGDTIGSGRDDTLGS